MVLVRGVSPPPTFVLLLQQTERTIASSFEYTGSRWSTAPRCTFTTFPKAKVFIALLGALRALGSLQIGPS